MNDSQDLDAGQPGAGPAVEQPASQRGVTQVERTLQSKVETDLDANGNVTDFATLNWPPFALLNWPTL
jgi:hypothetical protein